MSDEFAGLNPELGRAYSRIAELEAEIASLVRSDRLEVALARIAELEEELAGFAIGVAHAQQGQQTLFARIAELEANAKHAPNWQMVHELETELQAERDGHLASAQRIHQLEADYTKAEELTTRSHAVAKAAMERIAELEAERDKLKVALEKIKAEADTDTPVFNIAYYALSDPSGA